MFEAIQKLDLDILWALRSIHSPVLVWIAWGAATLGWKGWLWCLIIIGSWVRGRKDFSAQLAVGLVLAILAGLNLKGLIQRPRPDLYASLQLNIPMPELLTTTHSFPSGHALLAAVVAFVVWKYYKDWRSWLAFGFLALVSVARVYQGMHWPSDVIGSIFMGAIAAMVAGQIIRLPFIAKFLKPRTLKVPREFLVPYNELVLPEAPPVPMQAAGRKEQL